MYTGARFYKISWQDGWFVYVGKYFSFRWQIDVDALDTNKMHAHVLRQHKHLPKGAKRTRLQFYTSVEIWVVFQVNFEIMNMNDLHDAKRSSKFNCQSLNLWWTRFSAWRNKQPNDGRLRDVENIKIAEDERHRFSCSCTRAPWHCLRQTRQNLATRNIKQLN